MWFKAFAECMLRMSFSQFWRLQQGRYKKKKNKCMAEKQKHCIRGAMNRNHTKQKDNWTDNASIYICIKKSFFCTTHRIFSQQYPLNTHTSMTTYAASAVGHYIETCCRGGASAPLPDLAGEQKKKKKKKTPFNSSLKTEKHRHLFYSK